MIMHEKPPTPKGLGTRGGKFWRTTVQEFELSPGELQLLAESCRTLDILDALAALVARDGATTTGSAHQLVVHPAIGEARQQRLTLHRLLAALALPDDEGGKVPTAIQVRSATANRARWSGVDTEAAARREGIG